MFFFFSKGLKAEFFFFAILAVCRPEGPTDRGRASRRYRQGTCEIGIRSLSRTRRLELEARRARKIPSFETSGSSRMARAAVDDLDPIDLRFHPEHPRLGPTLDGSRQTGARQPVKEMNAGRPVMTDA